MWLPIRDYFRLESYRLGREIVMDLPITFLSVTGLLKSHKDSQGRKLPQRP